MNKEKTEELTKERSVKIFLASLKSPKTQEDYLRNLDRFRQYAQFNGFDFDLPLSVDNFKINIQGKGVFICEGDELSAQAKQALRGARRGSQITITDIAPKGIGTSTIIPTAAPLIVTLKN